MLDGTLALSIFTVIQFALAGTFMVLTGYMYIVGTRLRGVRRLALLLALFLPYIISIAGKNIPIVVDNAPVSLGLLCLASAVGFVFAAKLIKEPLEKKGPVFTAFSPRVLDGVLSEFYSAFRSSKRRSEEEARQRAAEWFLACQTLDLWHAVTTFVGVPGKGETPSGAVTSHCFGKPSLGT